MEENYICKFCCKVCKNANSLRNHERLCKENPERNNDFLKNLEKAREKRCEKPYSDPWNKGLTKENNQKIFEISLKNSGENHHFYGKVHSNESKVKISKSMIKAHQEGRAHNIGESRWNNEHSYPEKWLIKVLENEFNLKENLDYKTEYPFGRFSLDFAWPDKKICIEVDGKQHLYDEKQIERDKTKDKLLLENNWKELRIPWIECFRNPKNWIEIVREFLKGV